TWQGRMAPHLGRNLWDGTNPVGFATFAAVSRMVRRMDVKESPETHHLHVHLPSLLEGKLGYQGETTQDNDDKSFTSDKAPPEALAVKRIAVNFADSPKPTAKFDASPYREGDTLVSVTKQLR